MEIKELLKKGYFREFLSDKTKNLLSNKEENNHLARNYSCIAPTSMWYVNQHNIWWLWSKWHHACSCQEKHQKCQERLRKKNHETHALGNWRNKLHVKGVGESLGSSPWCPGRVSHCEHFLVKRILVIRVILCIYFVGTTKTRSKQ